MASAVDICNLALGHIGNKAEITAIVPPDGSAEAAQCGKFYPIARDECLSEFDWGFAKRRQVLAQISGTAPSGWEYWYTVPNPYLVARQLVVEEYDTPVQFTTESHETHGTIILANTNNAELWYTAIITDTTKYPPLFIHALSWLLASYLSLPLTREPKIKEISVQQYNANMGKAKAIDASQGKLLSKTDLNLGTFVPSGIKVRS
ncbi:MAG: hypothetical protein CMM33_08435 [Rhodospirillaceae bacterium]|nr:hypothetical protein [Rhodospirillaceae bacterium]|tara:strand:+ start:825 stop:1439 length:615 start_codon:yes stop_codon:yes gene_type:complete